ncbi:MAG TPA: DUF4388 domain-containing protein [Vicinamibacteria bacterium]
MALQGNLEDLPLLDIIQIVSFSKKTGYLSIEMEGGEGAIVFREGLVVSAFTATSPPADPRLGTLPSAARENAVRSRIGFALEQLARLREGAFGFELTDDVPAVVGRRDIRHETLLRGINPQEMLLDLAQGLDDARAQSAAAVEASFAAPEDPPAGPPPAPPPPSPASPAPAPAAPEPPPPAEPLARARLLLLVDDEPDVRQVLAGHFSTAGFQVVEAGDPEEAAQVAAKLAPEGPFVLVTDLGMPASGGASFHGGFEVVKRLWKMNQRPPILMMTESLSQSLRLRARQMGVQYFVFKPTLSKLNPRQFEADLSAFAAKLVSDVLPRLAEVAVLRPAPPPKRKASAEASLEGGPLAEGAAHPFEFLKRRLVELRQGGDANEIAVLVMKVAREFFERSILFVVKNDEARGLGGFGLAPREETLNLLARQVTIPLADPSVFRDVAQGKRSFLGDAPADRWTGHLLGRIGRFQSRGIALLPLVAHREAIALVFGDNPETGRPPVGLEGLEVFVQQAGIALENVFLQKKIQAIEGKDRTSVG